MLTSLLLYVVRFIPVIAILFFMLGLAFLRPSSDLVGVSSGYQDYNKPFLLVFSSEYCGRCQRVVPVVKSLYQWKYYKKMAFVLADVNDEYNIPLMQHFHVSSVPSIYLVGPTVLHMGQDSYRLELPVQGETSYSAMDRSLDGALRLIANGN